MILAIGDPHFRIDNVEETLQFCNELDKYIRSRNDITMIIVLGDILHTHEKLHTSALNCAIDFFKMLISHGRELYCLVGNHDAISNTIFLSTNHWLNALKGWDGITIVDTPIEVIHNQSVIVMCPYVPDGRFLEALHILRKDVVSKEKTHLIFGHQLLDGAKMGAIVAAGVEEWKEDYPLCISGHIHDKQWIKNNLYYTGSSLQHSYGEGGDKSLALIEIDDKHNIKVEEVYLEIKKKKIIYADVTELEEVVNKMKDDTEYKIVLSGNESDFKAIKQSNLFSDTLDLENVKAIQFKSKWNKQALTDEKMNNTTGAGDDFLRCLELLVGQENDPYLTSLYEHILIGKEDISDKDVLFF